MYRYTFLNVVIYFDAKEFPTGPTPENGQKRSDAGRIKLIFSERAPLASCGTCSLRPPPIRRMPPPPRPNPYAPDFQDDKFRCYCVSRCGGPHGRGKPRSYTTFLRHHGLDEKARRKAFIGEDHVQQGSQAHAIPLSLSRREDEADQLDADQSGVDGDMEIEMQEEWEEDTDAPHMDPEPPQSIAAGPDSLVCLIYSAHIYIANVPIDALSIEFQSKSRHRNSKSCITCSWQSIQYCRASRSTSSTSL